MFDIGFTELLVLTIVAMVVIGPERLPDALRTIGKSVGKVKRFFNSVQRQIDQELKMDELNEKIMKDTKDQVFPPNNQKSDAGQAKPDPKETKSSNDKTQSD